MVYITKSNFKRIIRKINLNNIDLAGDVYKKPIYFLNKYEIRNLLSMKALLENPEEFMIEVYNPISNQDQFRYVFTNNQSPAYHTNKDCERLNASFKNFEIPSEIRDRAQSKAKEEGTSDKEEKEIVIQEIEMFRTWFKKNLQLFKDDTESFLKKLDIRWNIQRRINEVELKNSGVTMIENINLTELEQKIDSIIRKAGAFFNTNKDKQVIIRRFQKMTFLAYKKDEISNNDTGLSDQELKSFLLYYDKEFKKPIKDLLIEYYRVKYNPELSFDGVLLERLNFVSCSCCRTICCSQSISVTKEF